MSISSEDIKSIYRKLVQAYAEDHPHNPLRLLNQHINACIKYEWKAKESAILDLALRKGIEIPKIKELIDKGTPKEEAILKVSQNMRLDVKESEMKKWVQDLSRDKREELEEEQKIEQQIKDYEKTVEKLTVLFHEGKISEESYEAAVKSLEDKLKGKERKRVSPVLEPEIHRTPLYIQREPSGLWYLVPFFFSIIGGLIGYIAVRDDDEDMAMRLLLFGIFMFFVELVVIWLYYRWLLSLF